MHPLPDAAPAGLVRMKRAATGLLLGVAVVLLVALLLPDGGAVGFLRAAAEAGLVGGLADWFAVTALFRHPLGLPVPHTALVPRQKDALAVKLGEFVTGNFLTADAVAAQVADARVVPRLAARLTEPPTAERVGRELATAAAAVLGSLDGANVSAYVLELLRRDVARRSYAPVLGALLSRAVEGEGQRPLVDLLASRGGAYLREHGEQLRPPLQEFLERQGLLAGLWATGKRVQRLLDRAAELLGEVERDPDHEVRHWVDGLLAGLAEELRTSPERAAALDAAVTGLLDDARLQDLLHHLVADGLASVRASLQEGEVQLRVTRLVQDLAGRVLTDDDLRGRLDRGLDAAVRYGVTHYGDSVVTLISRTVAGWEARDASARIEAAVGRDLQFIRINGTVVGALAGTVLHVVAVLVS